MGQPVGWPFSFRAHEAPHIVLWIVTLAWNIKRQLKRGVKKAKKNN